MNLRHFIRRLRAADRGIGKYLLYAGGEITLIVVGILLALQVNTWSEERERSALELRLLEGFRRDLQQDTATLSQGIRSTDYWIGRREILLERTGYDDIAFDSLTDLATRTWSVDGFNLATPTFEKLQSYTDGYPIRDQELLDRIIAYYTSELRDYNGLLEWDDYSTGEESRFLWYATEFESVPLQRALGLEEPFPRLRSDEASARALREFMRTERVRNAYRVDYYRKVIINRQFRHKKEEIEALLREVERALAEHRGT